MFRNDKEEWGLELRGGWGEFGGSWLEVARVRPGTLEVTRTRPGTLEVTRTRPGTLEVTRNRPGKFSSISDHQQL